MFEKNKQDVGTLSSLFTENSVAFILNHPTDYAHKQIQMSAEAAQFSGMSRAEFIRQMGLTDADITPPSSTGVSPKATGNKANENAEKAAPILEMEKVIEDDTWVRNTVFLDPSVIAEEQNNNNELRQTLLEEYRIRATATNQKAIAGEMDAPPPRDVLAEVTPERRREAADYKAQLLQQYLNRKANQQGGSPDGKK